jgi:hypothetical protein
MFNVQVYFSFNLTFVAFLPSICATSFTIFSSHSFIGHYMSRPNWPSSRAQVAVVKDSAAHSNAVFFPPIVVASGYFGYVGYHQVYQNNQRQIQLQQEERKPHYSEQQYP